MLNILLGQAIAAPVPLSENSIPFCHHSTYFSNFLLIIPKTGHFRCEMQELNKAFRFSCSLISPPQYICVRSSHWSQQNTSINDSHIW
jgi:hypothetical protein